MTGSELQLQIKEFLPWAKRGADLAGGFAWLTPSKADDAAVARARKIIEAADLLAQSEQACQVLAGILSAFTDNLAAAPPISGIAAAAPGYDPISAALRDAVSTVARGS